MSTVFVNVEWWLRRQLCRFGRHFKVGLVHKMGDPVHAELCLYCHREWPLS